MKGTRRNHWAKFKAKVTVAVLNSNKALTELAEHVGVPPTHLVSPYQLRYLEMTRAVHVWAADSIDVPIKRSVVYLFEVWDWARRWVWSWRRSST